MENTTNNEKEIVEVRIRHMSTMPRKVQMDIIKKATAVKNFKGFAKVTYVNASPKSIESVEPIPGNAIQVFENQTKKEGIKIPTF